MKHKITLLCLFLSILIASSVCAQKVYYWKDEKGVMNVTTTPPPDNIKKYETDSYQKDTKEEIEQYQRHVEQKRRADEATDEANRRAYQAKEAAQKVSSRQAEQQDRQQRQQREIQDLRNREADKLEAEARKTIPGARGITASQRNMLENAARMRVGEELVPYTPPQPPPAPPPMPDNSPTWGRIYDPKTGKYTEGWVYK